MGDKIVNGQGEAERINASLELGLTSDQVEKIRQAGYGNTFVNSSYKTFGRIVIDNVFTFFNLIFFVLAFFMAFVRSYSNMFFMVVVICNIFIGIFQQVRSKIKLDRLTLISSSKSSVVRNGEKQLIANGELVRDDIVLLKSGDQIIADAVLIKGEVQVDESLLTGESDSVSKFCGDCLLSGSFVVSGSCFARLEKVGAECYANKVVSEAKKNVKINQSDMMKSLDKLIKVIGFVIIPVGVIMFFKQAFLLNDSLSLSIKNTAGALVGMIPEGLYLLTSIALAISVVKLIEYNTLVHEMSCIETLARVNILCIDKTGTLTQPKMEVVGIHFFDNLEGTKIEKLLNAVVFNMPQDNETSSALKGRFNKFCSFKVKKIHPFTSLTKWFAAEFEEEGNFVVGAPEFVLKKDYGLIEKEVERYAAKGQRVLIFARLIGKIEDGRLNGEIVPLCLVLIENSVRKEASKTIKFFENQGVDVKVISGDNPLAVSVVCRKAKIKGWDSYVDASTLKTDEEISCALSKYSVFGRVTPNQKQKFVKLLKKGGKNTVAMIGDGVNDVLALRDADVGVAMASGSSAANQAAEIVLLNSDFSSMPKVVAEGRRVINNIERSAALFLVKNIFSFFLAIITLFANVRFPLTPVHFTVVSTLTIGMPSFFLTLESETSLIKGRFIFNVLKKALPGGLCNLLLVLAVQVACYLFSFSGSELSNMSVILVAANGLFVLIEVCKPLNWKRILVLLSVVLSMLISTLIFRVFGVLSFSIKAAVILIILIVLNYPLLKFLILIFNRKIFKNK